MALLTKSYTFTNGIGNNVDAVQINKDFDDLYTLVNGNIEAVNIKDATITLAKLATEVKVIENVYHVNLATNYTVTAGWDTFLTKDITLSAQRYCLILLKIQIVANTGAFINVDDGVTRLMDSSFVDSPSATFESNYTTHQYVQLASGAHTINAEAILTGTSATIFGYADGAGTYLTIIVFGF